VHYIYRVGKNVPNNYPVLQLQNLELLVEAIMASRAEHEWSALQSAFTTPKFSMTVGDALTNLQR
jgi:hypothetical protein